MKVVKFDGLYEAKTIDVLSSPEDRTLMFDVQAQDGRRVGVELTYELARLLKAQLDAMAAEHPAFFEGHAGSTSTH